MIQVYNNNDTQIEFFLNDDFLGPSGNVFLPPNSPYPYINYIINFWRESQAIKLFNIKKNNLIDLFNKDEDRNRVSYVERKIIISVTEFSDLNNPDHLIIKWKRHKKSEYSGRRLNSNISENKNYYIIKLKNMFPSSLAHTNECSHKEFFVTFGVNNGNYYLFILHHKESLDSINKGLDIQQYVPDSSFVSTLNDSLTSTFFAISNPSTHTSNRTSESRLRNLRICDEPDSHGTGLKIPSDS